MPNDGKILPLIAIPAIYAKFNTDHRLLRRQCRETFVLKDPQSDIETVITAKTVQLFIKHNYNMNDPDQDIAVEPHGYRKFAEDMNDFDFHETRWAYHIPDEGWTAWFIDNDIPTLVEFMTEGAGRQTLGSVSWHLEALGGTPPFPGLTSTTD
ncbi:hypothetical protein B0H11DRAFT_2216879 [Mycena galericulata]|nr:hypothetical protein B0H11DRAFT_2216879 [Mycena galericulata]